MTRKRTDRMPMYLTRWLLRPPHKRYLRTLKEASSWEGNLYVIVHGNGNIDRELLSAQRDGVHIIDARRWVKNGSLSHLVFHCRNHAYSVLGNRVGFGIMDDDCFYKAPLIDESTAHHIFEKEIRVGCCGPVTPYRFMAKYKSQGELGTYWPVDRSPWVTFGSQWYNMKCINRLPFVDAAMMNMQFRIDTLLWLAANAFGWKTVEYLGAGFLHTLSNSVTSTGYGGEWYQRRLRQSYIDFMCLIQYFRRNLPDVRVDEYVGYARAEWDNELNYTIQKVGHLWTPEWGVPLAKNHQELIEMVKKGQVNPHES